MIYTIYKKFAYEYLSPVVNGLKHIHIPSVPNTEPAQVTCDEEQEDLFYSTGPYGNSC